jgi:hypothetical protein
MPSADEPKENRHLDAKVAIEIFGWVWIRAKPCDWFTKEAGKDSAAANRMGQGLAWLHDPNHGEIGTHLYKTVDGSGKTILNTEYRSGIGEWAFWGYPPKYSSDWAETGKIVQKMKVEGFSMNLGDNSFTNEGLPNSWRCAFTGGWSGGIGEAYAGYPQQAICLAAIEAWATRTCTNPGAGARREKK